MEEKFLEGSKINPPGSSSNIRRSTVTGLLATLVSVILIFPLNVFDRAKEYGKVSEYFPVPTLMNKPGHQAACYYGETMWDLRCQADLNSSCGSVTS